MNYLVFLLQEGAAQATGRGGNMSFLIMMVLIFVVMYFFMIMPQKKKQKEVEEFRKNLQKGDKVVTVGGIYGTIVEVRETQLLIEVDKEVKIRVDQASVVKDFSDSQQG